MGSTEKHADCTNAEITYTLECKHLICDECLEKYSSCQKCGKEIVKLDVYENKYNDSFRLSTLYREKYVAGLKKEQNVLKTVIDKYLSQLKNIEQKLDVLDKTVHVPSEKKLQDKPIETTQPITIQLFTDIRGSFSNSELNTFSVERKKEFTICGGMGIFDMHKGYAGSDCGGNLHIHIHEYIFIFYPDYTEGEGAFRINNYHRANYSPIMKMGFTPKSNVFCGFKLVYHGKGQGNLTITQENNIFTLPVKLNIPNKFQIKLGCDKSAHIFSRFKDFQFYTF